MYNRIGKLTKDQLQEVANRVESLAGLIREMGYKKNAGGTYSVVKKYLQLHEVDTSHWKGQAWSKDQRLKDWSNYAGHQTLKKHLISQRSHACESCGLAKWIAQPIPLEVHHRDGSRTNNAEENLQLLCPNCHAVTDTWKGRNRK
jgi:5-methylcytosine-specific restriction endonuclease McrA